PYDRIDQSCDGFDLVDVDDDDYPGILHADWELLDLHPTAPAAWPDGLLNEVDCDDTDGTINPGADEVPYDRIDQNCDDYDLVDVDGDDYPGILRADWELLDLHPNAPGDWQPGVLDEPLDCDDNDPDVHPNDGTFDENCERAITDTRPVPEEQGEVLASGCACSSGSSTPAGGLLAVLGLIGGLFLRRRRI
ncbi:MAG: MYXO-CTERM sorting domain-containing protein, partial [Deltaproteobacteria bacterium]